MVLARRRFTLWVNHKLGNIARLLTVSGNKIATWGCNGHMNCPICDCRCHIENICVQDGMCYNCSPTPEEIKDEEPDAHIIPYGNGHVIQANNPETKALIVTTIKIMEGVRLTGGGMMYPANKHQLQEMIRALRIMGKQVELKVA